MPDTNPTPRYQTASTELRALIVSHSAATEAHNAASGDTPEEAAAFETLMAVESSIIGFIPTTVSDSAIKARFIYEVINGCTPHDSVTIDTGKNLDQAHAANLSIVTDLERLASRKIDTDYRGAFYSLENQIRNLERYARLVNRMENSGDVTEEERDELGMLVGVLQSLTENLSQSYYDSVKKAL